MLASVPETIPWMIKLTRHPGEVRDSSSNGRLIARKVLVCPEFFGVGLLDSRCGFSFVLQFILDRRHHAKRGVSALSIVEYL